MFFFFCVFNTYYMSPLPLVCSSMFQVTYVVLSVCVAVLCELKFGDVEVCKNILGNVEGNSAILFGKVCLWVLELLFTAYVQQQHNKVRSRGYLRFYREMQGLKYLQLNIHSTGMAAIIRQLLHEYAVHVGWICHHKMAAVLKEAYICVSVCLCAGNALLVVVLAARLSTILHTYMVLIILGLELLFSLPCLFYYTGMISVIIF